MGPIIKFPTISFHMHRIAESFFGGGIWLALLTSVIPSAPYAATIAEVSSSYRRSLRSKDATFSSRARKPNMN